jgi:hypothetical protein
MVCYPFGFYQDFRMGVSIFAHRTSNALFGFVFLKCPVMYSIFISRRRSLLSWFAQACYFLRPDTDTLDEHGFLLMRSDRI